MAQIPNDLKYSSTHEWARREADGSITVGITEHAQCLLGDIVFVELPEVGQTLKSGQETGVIESVKAASDLYSPLSGEILEVNETLSSHPALVNEDPYEEGWLFKLSPSDETQWDDLMDSESYSEQIEEEEGA